MTEKVMEIVIIPAMYVGEREDGNVLLKCLQGKETVNRAFEPILFKNIEDPKYILLGVMTGGNMMGLNVCDGNEFVNLFHKKWGVLLKD
jgi:hypothetical protein